jgi:hypothetical protein
MNVWVVDEYDEGLVEDQCGQDNWESGQNHVAYASLNAARKACERGIRNEIKEALDPKYCDLSEEEQQALRDWKPTWDGMSIESPVFGTDISIRAIEVIK